MLQNAFQSMLSSSSNGGFRISSNDSQGSLNPIIPSWMKEWMKLSNSKNNLKNMFDKEQYGFIIERIEEFEKSFRMEKENRIRDHDHGGIAEFRNDICYLSVMIDKVICSILNHAPLNDDSVRTSAHSSALDGHLSHLHRVLDTFSKKDDLSIHDSLYLIFGLKAYIIGVYNDIVLNQAHETTRKAKDIIHSLNHSLQFCLNIVLKKFVRKDLKDFDYFDSLQDAIEQHFSGYLFEDEQLAPKTKKRKKSSSSNLPMNDYANALMDYLDYADNQFIFPLLNLHIHIFQAFNYLNSLWLTKRKYSNILRTSYNPSTTKGVVTTVLKKLTNLCALNNNANLEFTILDVERTSNVHIILSLIEEGKLEDAKSICNCMTDYIPSLFLLGIIFLQEDNVKISKECFLQVVQLAHESHNRHEHTYLIHSCKLISLLFIKEWNLVDGLTWFQKACDLEKTENIQSKVESLYNICKIKEWIGELYSKRKVLKDIYQILTTTGHTLLTSSEKESISINPILILYQIGLCLLKEENFQNACQCFDYILTNLLTNNEKCWGRLNQNPVTTHTDELVSPLILLRLYIYCLLQTFNFEKAFSLCDFVLKKLGNDSPDIWPFQLYKCDALMALERPLSECELVLDSVLQGKDSHNISRIVKSIVYNNKALILICRHQQNDALKLLKKSLALLPETAFDDDYFKKMMYDLQASITFNITTTYVALNQIEDAAKWWFSFRKIPFSTHITSEQYAQQFTLLEQKQSLKAIKGDVCGNLIEDPNDSTTFMLLSHVTGKCTRQQQFALDLLMLKLYSKHLEKMEEMV
ncbi:hypothetical protein C9374_008723 [Naegleria lovaniensis]|uniref:Uncharacterized protein n=1 Tax=Naegleria lovaniensis TaxID=51637 RepID=A0AA88KHE3_NAELO|nr:uncharacterized protein C9374_008723 [Naegleria lovaniensis]KAG2378101.1 hypothetical protein C9374_008723 [Naegleria lovaniensis]